MQHVYSGRCYVKLQSVYENGVNMVGINGDVSEEDFFQIRDAFICSVSELLECKTLASLYLDGFDAPRAEELLYELQTYSLPLEQKAYAADSTDLTGKQVYMTIEILSDANADSFEEILKNIEQDSRTKEVLQLVKLRQNQ
ncbi:MAG: hypothetical protein LUE11_03195 [Clostridia bacterium]|nr:hypothetical protein [Clostridia bacterium]